MMRAVYTCVALLLLHCVLSLAQVADPATDKSKLIALENAWNQAQIERNGQALNSLLAETFVYTDWDGTVMNKAKFTADMNDPAVRTISVANSDVQVYFYPGVAVVTGAYRTKGTNQGKPFDHRGRFTDTWIFTAGQWRCVASHTNLVKR